jgi:hypothetical protein
LGKRKEKEEGRFEGGREETRGRGCLENGQVINGKI